MIESTKMSTIWHVYSVVTSYNFLWLETGHFTEGKYFNFVCMYICKKIKCNMVMIQRTFSGILYLCIIAATYNSLRRWGLPATNEGVFTYSVCMYICV